MAARIGVPATARKGEAIEIRIAIQHPMETGFRPGTNGTIIPRNIIERFVATWNGREIFRMDFSPAIAANPFVSFFAVAAEGGEITFRWTGDEGFAVEESVAIDVA